MTAIIMVTTVGNEEQGNTLAREIVDRRHAACVNVISGMKSFYRWKGTVCCDSEYLLIIKTMSSEYEAVSATIQELHSYEIPEILAFEISRGEAGFLAWILGSLDKNAIFEDDEADDDEPDSGAE